MVASAADLYRNDLVASGQVADAGRNGFVIEVRVVVGEIMITPLLRKGTMAPCVASGAEHEVLVRINFRTDHRTFLFVSVPPVNSFAIWQKIVLVALSH